MIGRKLFSPVSFIRFRMVALAPLFLVCRWRYTPYPAQQQKTIKEKTKLNTIIWFTFYSGYRWDSTIFSRPDPDSKNFVLPVLVRKEWFWIWRHVRARTVVGNKKTDFSNSVADPWHFGTDPDQDPLYLYLWETDPDRLRIRLWILVFSSGTF